MKILVAADLHVSDRVVMGRPRLPVYESMLESIWDIARENACEYVYFAGDVIDNKNKPPLEVLLTIQDALNHSTLPVYWLRGNHETPNKDNAERSVISLFGGRDVYPVTSWDDLLPTYDYDNSGRIVFSLPWYPPEEYKHHAETLRRKAIWERERTGKKPILITHIGLKEGSTSPSNFHPPSSVTVADLHPEDWAMIICGDYHAHQFLAKNVFYTGAPIPHNFGDFNIEGVWVIDTEELTAQAFPIPGAPRFVQWDMTCQDKPYWNADDYVRIHAHPNQIEVARSTYPEADIRAKVPEEQITFPDGSRISLDATSSHEVLITRYLEYKNVKEEDAQCLKTTGLRILESL